MPVTACQPLPATSSYCQQGPDIDSPGNGGQILASLGSHRKPLPDTGSCGQSSKAAVRYWHPWTVIGKPPSDTGIRGQSSKATVRYWHPLEVNDNSLMIVASKDSHCCRSQILAGRCIRIWRTVATGSWLCEQQFTVTGSLLSDTGNHELSMTVA
jgi:hypothetical protein